MGRAESPGALRRVFGLAGCAFAFLATWGWSQPSRAEPMFGGMTGYARGVLTRQVPETFSTISSQVYAGYLYKKVNAHVFFQSMDLSYEHGGESYSGVYGLAGIGVGFANQVQFFRRPQKIVLHLQMPLSGTYTVLTESSGAINDAHYIHSSLTTLQGGTAMQVLFGTDWLTTGRGYGKTGENFYVGTYLGYLSQDFAQQSTRIKTNNSTLAPPSPGTESVSYKVVVMSLNLSVNYDL